MAFFLIGQINLALAEECRDEDSECLMKAIKEHVIHTAKFWEKRSDIFQLSLEKRILDASPEIIDFLILDHRLNGYPNCPRSAKPDQKFKSDFVKALSEIPESLKKIIKKKLVGIIFVEDLGSSAWSELLRDENGRAVRGFIVFDYKQLKERSANLWASWKESSAFKPTEGYKLTMKIATSKNDTRKNALFFIVLHELSHIIAIGEDFHPAWDSSHADLDKTNGSPTTFPFTEISWVSTKESKYDKQEFPLRTKVHFYEGAELNASEMAMTYNQLKKTNFISLYGATNPFDDFAESLTIYVHGVILKRPYEVSIQKNGEVIEKFTLCWSEPRCREKREFLEKRFGFNADKQNKK